MIGICLKYTISLLIAPLFYSILLPPLITLGILNEITRCIVSIYLFLRNIKSTKENHKVHLSTGRDGIWEYRIPGNERMVLVVAFTNRGQLDNLKHCIESIEERIFSSRGEYEKLKQILVKYCGYVCWKTDLRFSMERHIRVVQNHGSLSGKNANSVVEEWTENDLMNLMSEELNQDMDDSKPQWEFVVIPNVIDSNGNKKSCLILRFHHAYMDGLSLLMLFNKLSDDFKYTLDPLKFKIPFWKLLILYTNSLLLTPYVAIQIYLTRYFTQWNQISSFPGHKKIYCWTKVISLQTLKIIRNHTKATISNIVSLAFTKACQQVLDNNGQELERRCRNQQQMKMVENLRITELLAFCPYPNSKPQNRFALNSYGISTKQLDGLNIQQQLQNVHSLSMEAMFGPCALVSWYSMSFAGKLPYFAFPLLSGFMAVDSFILSNVPAPREHFTFFGNVDCEELGAFPPVATNTGIILASISYQGGIKICGHIDSSSITEKDCKQIFEKIPIIIREMAAETLKSIAGFHSINKNNNNKNKEQFSKDQLNNKLVQEVQQIPLEKSEKCNKLKIAVDEVASKTIKTDIKPKSNGTTNSNSLPNGKSVARKRKNKIK